jgi:hypothetical protein
MSSGQMASGKMSSGQMYHEQMYLRTNVSAGKCLPGKSEELSYANKVPIKSVLSEEFSTANPISQFWLSTAEELYQCIVCKPLPNLFYFLLGFFFKYKMAVQFNMELGFIVRDFSCKIIKMHFKVSRTYLSTNL